MTVQHLRLVSLEPPDGMIEIIENATDDLAKNDIKTLVIMYLKKSDNNWYYSCEGINNRVEAVGVLEEMKYFLQR
jgi:hypothetical protein